ncbi:MAG: hypothetical protein PHW64_06475 [Sulfuricurvum sp.]|nr:hypothetical protein [Sulfuricurvum sp.]
MMNPKIVSDIVTILDQILPKNLYALDFTIEHYSALLKRLSVINDEERFNDKKGAIIKALHLYFQRTHQHVDIRVTFKNFSITKHFYNSSQSEKYDRLIHDNALLLQDIFTRKNDFSPLPYLISIPENIRTQILEPYTKFNDSMSTARNITRDQINTLFNLDPRDITIFIRGKISIRYFTSPKKIPPGADKRFAGESVELMETLYQHYFPKGAWENIEPILNEIIVDKLNFSTIDNATYIKTFIPVYRAMIEILLLEIVEEKDKEKIEGLTGFILRQYFHDILLFTAKNLLQYIEDRDKNAEVFIKYYVDEVIIDSAGNKVQRFPIVDKRQQKWNFSSILSVMMQYKQTKLRIEAQKEVINSADLRVIECQNELDIEKEEKKQKQEKLLEIENMIKECDVKAIDTTKEKVKSKNTQITNSPEMNALNRQYMDLLQKQKSLQTQLEIARSRITNKSNELNRRKKKYDYEQKMLESIIKQVAPIVEMYEMIAEAVAAVLSKR